MERRIKLFLGCVLLVALLLAGCITEPRTRAIQQDRAAGYHLGLTVDADLRVVAIDAESAATKAGVALGDQLVDLTWILSEVPEGLAGAAEGSGAATDTVTSTVTTAPSAATAVPLRPPPGVEYTSVPFTAPDTIREMISYGLPLRLQVIRNGEIHMLTIIPIPSDAASGSPVGAPDAPAQYF